MLFCILNITFIHQVHFQDGKECAAIKGLYNLLKDHRNPYTQDLVTALYQHSYQEEASKLLGEVEMLTQELALNPNLNKPRFQAIFNKCHR